LWCSNICWKLYGKLDFLNANKRKWVNEYKETSFQLKNNLKSVSPKIWP